MQNYSAIRPAVRKSFQKNSWRGGASPPSPPERARVRGARSGAVQTRFKNHNRLKFANPGLKLTLVHVARNWSRNRNHQNILLEDGVQVATGILSRSRSCIRANIFEPPVPRRYQSLEPVLVPASSMIEDLLVSISVP